VSARGGVNVLAVVEEPETARQCLMAAAAAALPHGRITALHVEVDPSMVRVAPEEISIQRMRESREGSSHDRAAQIQRIIEFWMAATPGSNAVWRRIVGTIGASLAAEVSVSDLIVICQPGNLDSADALHAALFHTAKPVLFVPRKRVRQIDFNHLVVAWKDTPQANRAVQLVQPWIAAATKVSVLIVEDIMGSHSDEQMERLTQCLKVPFELNRVPYESRGRIAASLLKAADRIQADAIVMGAYRYGQVFEWVFGGVTADMLQQSTLPVFLAH
jgi:nucleotide-binding universal stress UspA family protein